MALFLAACGSPGGAESEAQRPGQRPAVAPAGLVHEEFPPLDADWAEHPLARLAPKPVELGAELDFSFGFLNGPMSADADVPDIACGVSGSPDLGGIDLIYGASGQVEVMIWHGDSSALEEILARFQALDACVLAGPGFPGDLESVQVRVDGADESIVFTGTVDADDLIGLDVYTISVARAEEVLVMTFLGSDSRDGEDHAVDRVVAITELVLSKR